MKYVIIKETSDFESTYTEIIKVVSSKERANEIVSQLNQELELYKQIIKERYTLIEKLNTIYRNEIKPNQFCYSSYRKQSTYEITKEVATKTLGYTKEMWKKYVEEQNKIIEENKKNEEDWRLKSIEEQKRIDKEREVITKDFISNLSKEELIIYNSPWKDCDGSYSHIEVPYEE